MKNKQGFMDGFIFIKGMSSIDVEFKTEGFRAPRLSLARLATCFSPILCDSSSSELLRLRVPSSLLLNINICTNNTQSDASRSTINIKPQKFNSNYKILKNHQIYSLLAQKVVNVTHEFTINSLLTKFSILYAQSHVGRRIRTGSSTAKKIKSNYERSSEKR